MSESSEIELSLYDLHPGQKEVLQNARRFNVLNCGRRWGKTTFCVELLGSPDDDTNGALNGFPVGYFTPTYKNLMELWREVNNAYAPLIAFKSEQEKRIELYGGGTMDFWSLDSPETIRGRKYKRIITDETAIVRDMKNVWTKIMRPMLTDLKGDAWFLSTPRGKNNYFYILYTNEQKFNTWISHQQPTSKNPHIDPAEIAAAETETDPLTFAQEYLASFVTENLDAWAYCYKSEKHLGKTQLNRKFEVYISFDFNRNPITCFVAQHHAGIRGIEQIKLPNSNIYELCDYIKAKYNGCMFIITGDATGKASSALVQDSINYYTVIKSKLSLSAGQMKVHSVNPTVKENRVLVNSILHSQDIILDKEACKGLVFDLEHARVLPNGDLEKLDRKDPAQQLDALDCFRYYLNTFHKHLLRT